MKPNEILRQARIDRDLSEAEMAARANLSVPSYYDLEIYEEDFEGAYSITELLQICDILGIVLLDLYPFATSLDGHDFNNLGPALKEKQSQLGLSDEAFFKVVGWDVSVISDDPHEIINYPIEMLRAICDAVPLSWLDILFALQQKWTENKG